MEDPALYFRVTCCPHLWNLYCIQACALCSWVPYGSQESKAHAWIEYRLWRWDTKLPYEVHYSKFLVFLPILGRPLNELDGCTMGRMWCGHGLCTSAWTAVTSDWGRSRKRRINVVWDVAQCISVEKYHYRGNCCLYLLPFWRQNVFLQHWYCWRQ